VRSSRASPQGEFAYWDRKKLQRSLKEAAGELEARLAANTERRFPVMGLRGAAGALMIREMRLRLTRPIVAVTSTASEAEALAGEVAFFLGEAADADAATRRVHLIRPWEVKPMAQLSPPTDAQASQPAAPIAPSVSLPTGGSDAPCAWRRRHPRPPRAGCI